LCRSKHLDDPVIFQDSSAETVETAQPKPTMSISHAVASPRQSAGAERKPR
jgi:hypothetical protein